MNYYVISIPPNCLECECCHTRGYNPQFNVDGVQFCGITNMDLDPDSYYLFRSSLCPLVNISLYDC